MPVTLCAVTVNLVDITGETPAGVKARFERIGGVVGQDTLTVVPRYAFVETDNTGTAVISLMPGVYECILRFQGGSERFQISVPVQATALLSDLVAQAAPETAGEAALARDKAREWATNPEDDPVETGEFSARHWAAKAEGYANSYDAQALSDAVAATEADALATGQDRAQTGLDRIATAADRVQTGLDRIATAADRVQTGLDRTATEADRVLAQTARDAAESARDAAFGDTNVYVDIATGRAAVADGAQFMVVDGDDIVRYRRDTSSTQTEMARFPNSNIRTYVVEPFPLFDWTEPVNLIDVATPASGLTAAAAQYTIANAGRFYCVPTIASLGLAVGDTVRVAFRRISGSGQPTAITFRNGTTLVSTVNFKLVNGWWIAEAKIPATTTIIRIDWTNGTGADAVISRPRFARKVSLRDLPVEVRTRLRSLVADVGDKANLWPGAVSVVSNGGAGLIGDVVIANPFVTIPADMNASIRVGNNSLVRANGATLTAIVRLSTPLVRSVSIRYVGASAGTQVVALRHVGDGWWINTAAIATADPVGIDEVYIEVDNRAGTPSLQGYTAGAVTVGPIIVIDGADLPARLPVAAPNIYPDGELVLTQSAGNMQIAHRAGEPGKYLRWGMTRYDNDPTRAQGWRINALQTVTRNGDTSFSPLTSIVDSGETELAIREVSKTDFMGGATHGDMEETRALQLFVDGNLVTPDGATSYRASRIEAIQKAQLWEVDNGTPTLTATVITRWMWAMQEMRLGQRITWARSINLTAGYFAMLSLLRAVSHTAFRAPDYDPYDISAASHAMPATNSPRMITTGPGGIKVDMEVVKGWNANCRSFAEDSSSPARNKLYFSLCPLGGSFAVTAGEVLDFETAYRIGVS